MKRLVTGLCWSSLFLNDPIGFTIFGNRFALRRTGNDLETYSPVALAPKLKDEDYSSSKELSIKKRT